MAVAGSPLKAIPARARRAMRLVQVGAKAEPIIRIDEANSDTTMTGLRPKTSDSELATSMDTARHCVVAESERLAVAASTPNSWPNTGMMGCTQ